MKQETQKLFWIIIGAVLFNWVFWNEKMGLNTALFGLFIVTILFFLYPKARHSSLVRWLLAGHLLCLAMVLWHNSVLSKVAYMLTLSILVAFIHFIHRSIVFAGASITENAVFVFSSFRQNLPKIKAGKLSSFPLGKYIRFALIPLFLAFVFFVIYNIANRAFSDISSEILERFGVFIEKLFDNFSFGRIFFFLFGLFCTIVLLQKNKSGYFEKQEASMNDLVQRNKKKSKSILEGFGNGIIKAFLGKVVSGIMGLKHWNTIGIISLILLNILLAIINGIDISYIWVGFDPKAVNLYKLIHEGSDVLIFSILMAIAVIVIFFKGNLNFYKKSKTLRVLAYIWLIQNMILVISVFIRDYYYISEAGLARNRIGILFYLALVLFGLLSVCWKIYHKKSTYFLFRVNAWAAYVLLVVSTVVNWDVLIVNHNLSRKNEIVMPVNYMIQLSPSVLPILDKNRTEIPRHEYLMKEKGFWDADYCEGCAIRNLDDRIERYTHKMTTYSWLSWNNADAKLKTYFKK